MKIEFVAKIEVPTDVKSRRNAVILNIGIICFILTAILEFFMNNKIAFVFLVPLIYLISLRFQMGKRKYFKSVPVELIYDTSNITLIFINTLSNKKEYFSRKYTVKTNSIKRIVFIKEYATIQMLFDGINSIIDMDEQVVSTTSVKNEKIQFALPKESIESVLSVLGNECSIEYN